MSIRNLEIALLICVVGVESITGQEVKTNSCVQQESEVNMNEEAERLVSARNRVGSNLTSILRDSEQPIEDRLEAARLLAKLQFFPAIGDLIRNIDLVDPNYASSELRPDLQCPLLSALATFGDAAVPQILDAFVAERNQQRQGLLFLAIRFGKTTDVALRYLRGTEPPDEKDWLKKQNIEDLQKKLTSSFAR